MLYGTYKDWRDLHRNVTSHLHPESLSETAQHNLVDGAAALAFVHGEVPIPANISEFPDNLFATPYFEGITTIPLNTQKILDMRKETSKQLQAAKITVDSKYHDYMLVVGKVTLETGIGNCGDLVAAAYKWLLDNGYTKSLEVITANYMRKNAYEWNNHAFLVMSRDRTGDPSDPSSYGNDCVICDPWLDVCAYQLTYFTLISKFRRYIESFQPIKASSPDSTLKVVFNL